MDNHTDKPIMGRYQNLFNALQSVCGFTALQSDMDEIMRAIAKYCEIVEDKPEVTAENVIQKGIKKYNSNASDLHKFQFSKGEMKFFCELFEEYAQYRLDSLRAKAGDRLPSNDDLTARFTTRTPNGSYLIGHRDIEVAKWMKEQASKIIMAKDAELSEREKELDSYRSLLDDAAKEIQTKDAEIESLKEELEKLKGSEIILSACIDRQKETIRKYRNVYEKEVDEFINYMINERRELPEYSSWETVRLDYFERFKKKK